MASLAKELLNLPSPPQTPVNLMASRKKTKCLVFFTSDKTVGIVSLSSIANNQSGIKPEDVEEGVMYEKVRFQGKPYQGKVLKISDDVNALKKEQDIVAFSLNEASSENESGETVTPEPEPEPQPSHELEAIPECPKNNRQSKLSEKRAQVIAKAAAQREMFRNEYLSVGPDDSANDTEDLHESEESSVQADSSKETEKCSEQQPQAVSLGLQSTVSLGLQPAVPAVSSVNEPTVSPRIEAASDTSQNSSGHSDVPYVPGQHRSAFSHVQVPRPQSYWNPPYQLMPFERQISQAMTLSDNFIEPHEYVNLQQENARLLKENMQLKAELDGINQSRECVICSNNIKASTEEVSFLRRIADVLSGGSSSPIAENSLEMESGSYTVSAPVVPSKTMKTVPQKRKTQEDRIPKPSKLSKPHNVIEGDAQVDQVDVELFPGTGVIIPKQKLKYALVMSKGKTSKKMVRRLLEAVFSEEELVQGCAVGCSRGKKSSSTTIPLDKAKVEAIKAYVRDQYKEEDLTDAQLHRTINCACADLRGKHKTN